MLQQSPGKMVLEFLERGRRKRLSIPSVRNLMIGPAGFVWLLLCLQSRSLPAQAEPQQPTVAQAPGQETPIGPQLLLPGNISGTVIDGTGAIVVGAQVTLTRAGQSAPQEVVSGGNGQFFFGNVLPGSFQIRITARGFAPRTFAGLLHSGEVYLVPPTTLALATSQTEIQVTASRIEVAEAQIKAQEKQRILGVIPNFYVSYIADAAPLTSKQKFELAWKSTIDPVTIALTGLAAGVQQAQNEFGEYGQGALGYAKRFGAAYADNATGTFIGGAILPSLFKQDPRYFYKGTGSAGSRILYAIGRSVISKGDNQRWQPNYSGILGSLASGAISNLYYPEKDRGADLVFRNVLVGAGETAVVNLFQEFVVRHFTTHVPKHDPSHPFKQHVPKHDPFHL
jgi:hypothetical protein